MTDPREAFASVGMVEDSVKALNQADADEADRRAGGDLLLRTALDAEAANRIHDVGSLADRITNLEHRIEALEALQEGKPA